MKRARTWAVLLAWCALTAPPRAKAQPTAAPSQPSPRAAESRPAVPRAQVRPDNVPMLPIVCAEDLQLTEAAAELLLARVQRPSALALAEAVRSAGSDGVGLHALFVPSGSPADAEQQWLASLRARVDGELHCGRADNEAGRLVIALGRAGELAAIDLQARIVRGQLRAGFRDAELVIEAGDAQLVRVGVTSESLSTGIALSPELSLPLKVQLVARGPAGPRPVAERQLFAAADSRGQATEPARAFDNGESATRDVAGGQRGAPTVGGGESPARHAASGRRDATAADGGERGFSERVLQLRAARGRRGLRPNRLLREVATRHAQDVCAKGKVAHEVEPGAGPDARLAQAGLDARVLGEAVARAEDTDSALHALQNSPSHLFTLLDPRFTDFGVGVAKDQAQKYCYVVLLCAWPRYVGKRAR